jgi:hypothetical protein
MRGLEAILLMGGVEKLKKGKMGVKGKRQRRLYLYS